MYEDLGKNGNANLIAPFVNHHIFLHYKITELNLHMLSRYIKSEVFSYQYDIYQDETTITVLQSQIKKNLSLILSSFNVKITYIIY